MHDENGHKMASQAQEAIHQHCAQLSNKSTAFDQYSLHLIWICSVAFVCKRIPAIFWQFAFKCVLGCQFVGLFVNHIMLYNLDKVTYRAALGSYSLLYKYANLS